MTDQLKQCDGCRRGLPVDEQGTHYDPAGDYDRIVCTKNQYVTPKSPKPWRVGRKVAINVYDEWGNLACRCHSPAIAALIVKSVNAVHQTAKDAGEPTPQEVISAYDQAIKEVGRLRKEKGWLHARYEHQLQTNHCLAVMISEVRAELAALKGRETDKVNYGGEPPTLENGGLGEGLLTPPVHYLWSCSNCKTCVYTYQDLHVNERPHCVPCNNEMEPTDTVSNQECGSRIHYGSVDEPNSATCHKDAKHNDTHAYTADTAAGADREQSG